MEEFSEEERRAVAASLLQRPQQASPISSSDRAHQAQPSAPPAASVSDGGGTLSFEAQRREALERQRQRWQQLHGQGDVAPPSALPSAPPSAPPPPGGGYRLSDPGHAYPSIPGLAHGSGGGHRLGGGGSGFRVTSLPGGGFAATYSSGGSSGGGAHAAHAHARAAGPGGDPLGGSGGGGGGAADFLMELLLAGAHSGGGHAGGGFAHHDPATGASHYEPAGGAGGGGGPLSGPTGLESLIGALMGDGMFSSMGWEGRGHAGGGGWRYEDLAGLAPVNVPTPPDVVESLPRSTYVEGRRPGDSDTCVICQAVYSAGERLMHLPCLHAFHADCISPWLQGSKRCPVCRDEVC